MHGHCHDAMAPKPCFLCVQERTQEVPVCARERTIHTERERARARARERASESESERARARETDRQRELNGVGGSVVIFRAFFFFR
jgi:hypothetical protein